MPGFSFFATLLAGLGAWWVRDASRRALLLGSMVGVVVVVLGQALDLRMLTVVGILGASVTVGSGLGQAFPLEAGPFYSH